MPALAAGPEECTDAQLYQALLALTQQLAAGRPAPKGPRKLYYFSAEFLMGKLLSNNLLALGLFEPVRAPAGCDGPQPGRSGGVRARAPRWATAVWAVWLPAFWTPSPLWACPGDGVGLNYHYGLFHQKFVDRRQQEQPRPLDPARKLAAAHRKELHRPLWRL